MINNERLLLLEDIALALDRVSELASRLDGEPIGKSIINDIEPISCEVVNEIKQATLGWQVV